jgi:hypothetical protein
MQDFPHGGFHFQAGPWAAASLSSNCSSPCVPGQIQPSYTPRLDTHPEPIVPLLFAVTLFVSASLLFMVQPMVGKMILPLLGGSPAVWNACMVFFQALLLLGYLYAHHVSTKYEPKRQWALHMIVLAVPIFIMVLAVALSTKHTPIAIAESLAPSGDTSPFLAVMGLMTVAIGVPFFVASTSAPLIQKWFSYTGHPSSRDPYFLYAASNLGSLISLLGYPLFIEPNLTVAEQAWVFGAGFLLLIGLIAMCGKAAANPLGVPPIAEQQPTPRATAASEIEADPTTGRILKWVMLAFIPSSLMLGVTFYMTTDIASIPLLWVVPLALYLVTFIIAFARLPDWFRLVIGNLAPVMILLLVFVIVAKGHDPDTGYAYLETISTTLEIILYNATFFFVALMCHYELAVDRPKNVSYLTKYFLMMSVGGVLGGVFNALIAPIIFPVAYEFYVTLVLACLMVPNLAAPRIPSAANEPITELEAYKRRIARLLDFILPALTGFTLWLLLGVVRRREFYTDMVQWLTGNIRILERARNTIVAITLIAIPVMACFFFVDRAFRFALAVAVLLVIHLYRERDTDTIYTERTFFGILKVEKRNQYTRLVHGTTLHGTQIYRPYLLAADAPVPFGSFSPWDALALEGSLAAWDPRQEPLTYYHRTGPVGAMFHELRTRKNGADAKAHFAMVGLGTGSVSCYGLSGQKFTFYEIDAAVRRIVEKPWMVMNPEAVKNGEPEILGPFTYVDDARKRGAEVDFRMGDARLKLKEDVDRKYALLLVDAFSSDAIPVHLLTKEAVELYMNRITEDGILALHISNKFISLEPVVARIAEELKLESRVWRDDSESRPGKTASSWIVLAKDAKTLGTLAAPTTDQILAFGTKNQEAIRLLRKYGADYPAAKALEEEYPGGDKLALEEFGKQFGGQAAVLVQLIRRGESKNDTTTLGDLALSVFGRMFHKLELNESMPLWTDDYSDVLRVMMLKEVQAVRRFFGLPTLNDDE